MRIAINTFKLLSNFTVPEIMQILQLFQITTFRIEPITQSQPVHFVAEGLHVVAIWVMCVICISPKCFWKLYTSKLKVRNCWPANYEVDRIWFCLDCCLCKSELISRPKFIPKEAACIQHLIPYFQSGLGSIPTTVNSLTKAWMVDISKNRFNHCMQQQTRIISNGAACEFGPFKCFAVLG